MDLNLVRKCKNESKIENSGFEIGPKGENSLLT
jgi:hypothetical protein